MGGGGDDKQESTTTSNPWDPAQGHLKDILSGAGDLFGQQGGIDAQWFEQKLAGIDPATQAAWDQLKAGGGLEGYQNQYGQLAQQGLGGYGQGLGLIGQSGQPITGQQVNDLTSQYYNQAGLNEKFAGLGTQAKEMLGQAQAGISGNAIQSGTLGGGRTLLERGQAAGRAQAGLQSNMAQLQLQENARAQQQALSQLAGNRGALMQAGSGLMQGGLSGAQAGIGGGMSSQQQQIQNMLFGGGAQQQRAQQLLDLQRFNQGGRQQAGWDALSRYLGIAGPIGGMGGTNTSVTSGGGGGGFSPGAAIGAIGGGYLGNMAGMPGVGASLGASFGGSF